MPLWKHPRWMLALLLAGLATIGPFSVDTYLPAFAGIQQSLGSGPAAMQQTLSGYFFGFAFAMLFHGAASDSFGRRIVILVGLGMFTLASIGCALADSLPMLVAFRVLQGMSAGAGMIVGRAITRDLFDDVNAQKLMSTQTLFFGIAPAVAPMIGGLLYDFIGWRSIFWFLAAVGALMAGFIATLLPETLPPDRRQPFALKPLLAGYREVGLNPTFIVLSLAAGIPFNGFFVYVLSAPTFLGELLGLKPTQFWWLFVSFVAGIMGGAFISGRLAGRVSTARQIIIGYTIMATMVCVNLIYAWVATPSAPWVFLPIAIYAIGWAMVAPAVSMLVLDLYPARRGMASSLQGVLSTSSNGLTAAIISPLVMHSVLHLALASLGLFAAGLTCWLIYRWRVAPKL